MHPHTHARAHTHTHARTHARTHAGLPKTRSGKIMRRVLRKVAANDISELGDTSTLADPSVVVELISRAAALRGD
jgi:acyl-coenzyme A synthetase/AMP-(fatty) acid ligase